MLRRSNPHFSPIFRTRFERQLQQLHRGSKIGCAERMLPLCLCSHCLCLPHWPCIFSCADAVP